jgi:hypothetical protein
MLGPNRPERSTAYRAPTEAPLVGGVTGHVLLDFAASVQQP